MPDSIKKSACPGGKPLAFKRITAFSASGSFAVVIGFGCVGKKGIVSCAVCDFTTREKLCCRELPKINSLELTKDDFSFSSQSCTFSFCFNTQSADFNCDFKKSFSHTEMKADIRLSFDNTNSENSVPVAVSGSVAVKNRVYTFNSESDFGIFENVEACFNRKSQFCYGFAVSKDICIYLADSGKSGRVLYRGMEKAIGDFKIDKPSGDFMKPWKISDSSGTLEFTFNPGFNDYCEENNPVLLRGNRLFGLVSGTLSVDGEQTELKDIPAYFADIRNYR